MKKNKVVALTLYSATVTLLFFSCENLGLVKKNTQTEVEETTTWHSGDQFPSFAECERFDADQQKACFVATVSDNLTANLSTVDWQISDGEEITLTLNCDKEGNFSVHNVSASSYLRSRLPDLDEVLAQAVLKLPTALPALKTNVGVAVNCRFDIIIDLSANSQ